MAGADQHEAGRGSACGIRRSPHKIRRTHLRSAHCARAALASPPRAPRPPTLHPPCPKRCTPCSTSPSRRRAPPGRSSTAPRSTSTGCRSTPRRRTISSPRSTTPPRRRSSTSLLGAYPGHGILAEESGNSHGASDSEYVWIIDPLDGTTNFIHGLPIYAVSIGLAYREPDAAGGGLRPGAQRPVLRHQGRGAFLNDRRLRVSKRTRMADALIGTGFPFRQGRRLRALPADAARR